LVEADAGPDGDGFGRAPRRGAARRYDGAGSDETFEVRGVRVERPELSHRSAADRDDRSFPGAGNSDRLGEAGAQLSDTK
jgi:hypothetical protein